MLETGYITKALMGMSWLSETHIDSDLTTQPKESRLTYESQ